MINRNHLRWWGNHESIWEIRVNRFIIVQNGCFGQTAIQGTHFEDKTIIPRAGLGRNLLHFHFLRFSCILIPMSGFSWPDVPSVALEGDVSPVPQRCEYTGGFV